MIGPQGGDVDNLMYRPERRRASLNAEIDPNSGMPMLHRSKESGDSCAMGLKNAQPWHQMAAHMLVAGRTNQQIADAAGVHPMTVSTLRAQHWFQELVAIIANKTGEGITSLLAAEAVASIEEIVDLRNSAESERVRLAAATFIVEQVNGKATQKVEAHQTHSFVNPDEERQQIENELRALRGQN